MTSPRRFYSTSFTLIALSFSFICSPAFALTASENYFSPEVQYHRDLSQKISVSKKINVNHASLNELKTLPGIDEDIALKMMRIRPIENIRDFQRMNWVSPREIQQMIQNIQGRVSF